MLSIECLRLFYAKSDELARYDFESIGLNGGDDLFEGGGALSSLGTTGGQNDPRKRIQLITRISRGGSCGREGVDENVRLDDGKSQLPAHSLYFGGFLFFYRAVPNSTIGGLINTKLEFGEGSQPVGREPLATNREGSGVPFRRKDA